MGGAQMAKASQRYPPVISGGAYALKLSGAAGLDTQAPAGGQADAN
jgi:hypothetical protein